MDVSSYIKSVLDQKGEFHVTWDSTKDILDIQILDFRHRRLRSPDPEIRDSLIDLIIDQLKLDTQENEFTKGNGKFLRIEDKLYFDYSCQNRFLEQFDDKPIQINIQHAPEIEQYLKRSSIVMKLSLNDRNFIRVDIRPDIVEGDAYALGNHLLEKYRIVFQKVLFEEYSKIIKAENCDGYELLLSCSLFSINDNIFHKKLSWYKTTHFQNVIEL